MRIASTCSTRPCIRAILADVGRFAGELQAVASGGWVFVDEIQRLPGLLNEVHRHIEDSGLRFILTGSSARKLKRVRRQPPGRERGPHSHVSVPGA